MALESIGSLGDALPSVPQATPTTTGEQQPPLEIKVMSWNIHGGGGAGHRNRLVPAVVREMKPDVLLLQQTKPDTLVNLIKDQGRGMGRQYDEVSAADKSESRVLYDSNLFEAVPRDARIFPGRDGMAVTLSEALEMSLPEERGQPQVTRRGRVEGMRDVFRRRIALVGLKRREHALVHDKVIVFISYHNLNTSRGGGKRHEGAEGFCQIVQSMRQLTATVVIGGADLNQPVAHPTIITYEPTQRRKMGRRVIDYIARDAPPGRLNPDHEVIALDFVGAAGDPLNPLHQLMKNLLRPSAAVAAGGVAVPGRSISTGDYGTAVDHDPLVCDFSLTFIT